MPFGSFDLPVTWEGSRRYVSILGDGRRSGGQGIGRHPRPGDRRPARREHRADARSARADERAPRHRPGARSSTRPSTSGRSPGRYVFHRALSLDVLRRPAAHRRAADRRRPQLVHGLPRAAGARRPTRAAPAHPLPVCWSCTTWAGPTAAGTSTTSPRRSPRSSASRTGAAGMRPGSTGCSTRAGMNADAAQRHRRRAAPATAS